MGVKMNFRIITKNHEADAVIGFLTKSISKPFDRSKAIPPAWELRSQDLKKNDFDLRTIDGNWSYLLTYSRNRKDLKGKQFSKFLYFEFCRPTSSF